MNPATASRPNSSQFTTRPTPAGGIAAPRSIGQIDK